MEIRIKPVHALGMTWHVFPQSNCQLEVATSPEAIPAHVEQMHRELRGQLRTEVTFLEPAVVRDEGDLRELSKQLAGVDGLLVNVTTGGLMEDLFRWQIPVIAYSGDCAPMMGLYTLPLSERAKYANLTYALDAGEVDAQLQLIRVRKKLKHSKVVILGEYMCADKLPDPETVKNKLGVEFVRVSGADFVERLRDVDPSRAETVARGWEQGALPDGEPSAADVRNTAGFFVALEGLLQDNGAQAVSVGCLELMYAHAQDPFCLALAELRDQGLPAGCEADMSATLTMLLFEYLAERPAYMGNLVRAEPRENLLHISHGCSPRSLAGRDRPAMPYRLVHSHSAPPFSRDLTGGSGVTSYVDYGDVGQEVTIARMGAGLDVLTATRGEIKECSDTICDRTTLTLRVRDARGFVHKATGNHQVVVYGDFVEELRGLCRLLDMTLIEA